MRELRRRSPLGQREAHNEARSEARSLHGLGEVRATWTAQWRTIIEQLERATQDLLRGDGAAAARGRSVIASATPVLQAIAQETNNRPDAALSERWVQALEAFNAAIGSYDPDAAPRQYGVVPSPGAGIPWVSSDGVRFGNTIVGWPLVIGGALFLYFVGPKLWRGRPSSGLWE